MSADSSYFSVCLFVCFLNHSSFFPLAGIKMTTAAPLGNNTLSPTNVTTKSQEEILYQSKKNIATMDIFELHFKRHVSGEDFEKMSENIPMYKHC